MRKINLLVAVLFAATLFLSSCDVVSKSFSSYNMTNPEDIKSISNIIQENFSGKDVYTLSLSAEDDLSVNFSNVYLQYLDNGKSYNQSYFQNNGLTDPKKTPTTFNKNYYKPVKISDIDITVLPTRFNEAVKFVEEQTDEFEDFILYDATFTARAKGLELSLILHATKKGEGTSLEGRNIVTNFYEFKFEVTTDGKLEYKE